ncbi:MAG: GNAT family N-acetyltransferase [Hyphomicrobiales bacterium]
MRTPPRETSRTSISDEAARAIMRIRGAGRPRNAYRAGSQSRADGLRHSLGTDARPLPSTTWRILPTLSCSNRLPSSKILSDDISHKSDVGGVRLGLRTPQEARHAAERMLARARELCPDAHLQGFTIQPMIMRKQAHELLMGVYEDQLFGPMILFGAGGTATEIIHDTAVAMPPLDIELAYDLMAQTRIYKLLQGYRDQPPANLKAIAESLVHLSQLVVDCPAVMELDINPLVADETGVIALDARIRIDPALVEKDGPNPRLAIRPYPNQWERWTETVDGQRILIRPIRPADEHLYGDFVAKLSPEDIRFRFLAPRKEFSHKFVARFTQIDYARAMAFMALDKDEKELLGVARLAADPNYDDGEYAIIVRSDIKGSGIGWLLMRQLIRYAEREGLQELTGDVLEHNTRMLDMCRALGFEITTDPEDMSIRKVRLKLPSQLRDAA